MVDYTGNGCELETELQSQSGVKSTIEICKLSKALEQTVGAGGERS